MSAKDLLIDPALLDYDQVVADVEEIRRYNPQRFEMEQLTAVIYEDLEEYACAGYKDIGRDEFWVRGHMPDMPLMPGVIVLEAAAQLCSFFSQKHDLLGAAMIGFGGLENVRFRAPIIPGDRLLLICKMTKVRPGRMIVCRFQAVVGETLAVDGMLKGIPIPVDAL
ncbi:MAG: 3-hydroxyacyl-ACP dehydratase FabZ family protein [Planctomycetota bacterium]|nr:3-hydroxyacyl-ACP dehydratase FabZ family protein [Planctomycetota bacterium]